MVYLSDSKREILERRKTVILHYMQYEADIRAKKITPSGAMCKVAAEVNMSADGVRYILTKEGVYINKDVFLYLDHLSWTKDIKERMNLINHL